MIGTFELLYDPVVSVGVLVGRRVDSTPPFILCATVTLKIPLLCHMAMLATPSQTTWNASSYLYILVGPRLHFEAGRNGFWKAIKSYVGH
jgi:hypothetical protein